MANGIGLVSACRCRKLNPVGGRGESDDLGWMLDLLWLLVGSVADLFRSRSALEAEILVLRQQINVLRRGKPSRLEFLAVDKLALG